MSNELGLAVLPNPAAQIQNEKPDEQTKAAAAASADTQPPEPDDAPDDQARKRMRSTAERYAGGGRAAAESSFYGSVGAAHTGSGSVYYNYYGAEHSDNKRASAERVIQAQLKKVRAVYVQPQLHGEAQQRLAAHHMLVLAGQTSSTGRHTAALSLLAELHADKLFELSPNVDLDDLKAFVPDEGCGYLIENLAPDRVRALHAALFRRLHGQLADAKSHLLVTIPPGAASAADSLGEYVLAWNDLPDCAAVLRQHLIWRLAGEACLPKALGYCGNVTVQKAYQNQPPARIDVLAQLLAKAARDTCTLAETLAEFAFDAKKQVAKWFEQHHTIDQRTLMLSVAVFHGGRYSSAAAADTQLREAIKPPVLTDAPPPAPPIFERTGTVKLRDVGARLERKPERSDANVSIVERVCLDTPALQPAVVQYAWQEFAELREPLLAWLAALGASDDDETCDLAAGAIGELAKYDFSAIFSRIIEPSADSDNVRARKLAALALGILAAQKELAPQILSRLHEWSVGSARWPRWTAALAYGQLVGREFPADALKNLNMIVRSQDRSIISVVRNSVVDIFGLGSSAPDYYFRVIEALSIWVADAKSNPLKAIWLDTFVRIARDVKHRPASQPARPALLWIYEENSAYQSIIRGMLRMALNIYPARDTGLSALQGWLRTADDQPAIYPTIELFMRDLMAESNAAEQERLRYWLARWCRDPKQPCQSACAISGL